VSWRKTIKAIFTWAMAGGLFAVFGIFIGILIVGKLPMILCGKWRRIRYLPVAGVCHYGLLVPMGLFACGLAWWEVLLLAMLFALAGGWLLPNPYSFIVHPRRRRAVLRAIEFVEIDSEVFYGMVYVLGEETGRTIVSVSINSGTIPAFRRFVAVGNDGTTVEDLSFEYVAANHNAQPVF
jgi:hypothetical protein